MACKCVCECVCVYVRSFVFVLVCAGEGNGFVENDVKSGRVMFVGRVYDGSFSGALKINNNDTDV